MGKCVATLASGDRCNATAVAFAFYCIDHVAEAARRAAVEQAAERGRRRAARARGLKRRREAAEQGQTDWLNPFD